MGEELAQYQANSTASTTITQLGDQERVPDVLFEYRQQFCQKKIERKLRNSKKTQYIPIVPNQIVEGQLSDSEAETETETDKLKAEIDSLKRQLSEKDSEYYTAENQARVEHFAVLENLVFTITSRILQILMKQIDRFLAKILIYI